MHVQPNESLLAKLRSGLAVLALVSASALAAGCLPSGSDDEEDEDENGGETANFAGVWAVSETMDESACGGSTYTNNYVVELTQNGTSVTITDGVDTITGTVDGNTLTWSDEAEDGSVSYEATISGDTMSGGSEWTWTDGSTSCSGTSTFEAVRTSGGGDGDGSGDGSGDGDGDGSGDGSADHQEIEPNDAPGNATAVTLTGSTVSYGGTVDDTTDEIDIYAFVPSSSAEFTIAITGPDAMDDIDLGIYDSDGMAITGSATLGPNESVTVNLSGGVLYYIGVEAYDTLTGGVYTLTVTRN